LFHFIVNSLVFSCLTLSYCLVLLSHFVMLPSSLSLNHLNEHISRWICLFPFLLFLLNHSFVLATVDGMKVLLLWLSWGEMLLRRWILTANIPHFGRFWGSVTNSYIGISIVPRRWFRFVSMCFLISVQVLLACVGWLSHHGIFHLRQEKW
jgi:hypothetical protein